MRHHAICISCFEAYQLHDSSESFDQRFKRFVTANSRRKVLLNRLSDLLK
jgi:hypothetical protein